MKLSGGDWSRGDLLAVAGVALALVALIPSCLSVPGMPRVIGSDDGVLPSPATVSEAPAAKPAAPLPPVRVAHTKRISSGQVNFGCGETRSVTTPALDLGKNPLDVTTTASWQGLGGAKSYGQRVVREGTGVYAAGDISGRDKELFGNCPGGGNGELVLDVSWTAET